MDPVLPKGRTHSHTQGGQAPGVFRFPPGAIALGECVGWAEASSWDRNAPSSGMLGSLRGRISLADRDRAPPGSFHSLDLYRDV